MLHPPTYPPAFSFSFSYIPTQLLSIFLSPAFPFFLVELCLFLYPSFSGALFQGDFFDLHLLKYPHPVLAFFSLFFESEPLVHTLKEKP